MHRLSRNFKFRSLRLIGSIVNLPRYNYSIGKNDVLNHTLHFTTNSDLLESIKALKTTMKDSSNPSNELKNFIITLCHSELFEPAQKILNEMKKENVKIDPSTEQNLAVLVENASNLTFETIYTKDGISSAIFEAMSDLMPNDWRTLFLIGLKHFTEGDAEKALLYADQCIEAAPEERKYIGMMQKATVLRFLERNDESKTMLVKTIQSKHDPSDTNALKIMTHAHMMLHKLGIEGKHAELAMDYVNKLVQESPDKTDAKITRGILSSTLGNIEDALPDLQLAVETYPDDYQYKGELANCLSILGEFVEARELWKKAIEIAPDNADVYLGMAMNELAYASTVEENEQIIKEGIDLLKKAVTLDPNHKIANDVLKNIFQSMTGPE